MHPVQPHIPRGYLESSEFYTSRSDKKKKTNKQTPITGHDGIMIKLMGENYFLLSRRKFVRDKM